MNKGQGQGKGQDQGQARARGRARAFLEGESCRVGPGKGGTTVEPAGAPERCGSGKWGGPSPQAG
jgi:hypothetical protein